MKYLPFENISYKSKLDSGEVLERINQITEPKKAFRLIGFFVSSNQKPYEGWVDGRSFKLNRIIAYGNSFLPIISGSIEKDFNGSTINIKMRLNTFVLVFIFIWFGGVGIACLAAIVSLLSEQNFDPLTLIPFGMLIFAYALVTGGFKYESIKSKKYFAKLFGAEIK